MAWPIVDYNGLPHYKGTGTVLVPVDGTGVAHIFMREDGGIIGGVSGVMQGDPGAPPGIQTTVNSVELAHDDPTPASASWTQLSPPNETYPGGLYQYNHVWHAGAPGAPGATVWDPTDLDPSPVAGQVPVVKSTLDGFDLVAQKIPEVFYPGEIDDIPSGNTNFTVTAIPIPARPWARRLRAGGYQVVTGEAADVRVDLLARLNNETGGNIVGRCQGIAQVERLTLDPGKPIETGTAADTYNQIAANSAATVYVRTERKAGTSTYIGSASQAQFWVEALPL